jgi:hypothetical protein
MAGKEDLIRCFVLCETGKAAVPNGLIVHRPLQTFFLYAYT